MKRVSLVDTKMSLIFVVLAITSLTHQSNLSELCFCGLNNRSSVYLERFVVAFPTYWIPFCIM